MEKCDTCGSVLTGSTGVCIQCGPPTEVYGAHTVAVARSAPAVDGSRFVPGSLVSERYRIIALLGRGGMGEVYRADDLSLGQQVALKFLPADLAQNEDALRRFRNEVRIARQVSHPNVCRVYDLGEIDLKMSGCMNACGHHHIGNIGILGVDKGGEEWYQITIGGAAGADASLGSVIGPSVAKRHVPETLARILEVYVEQREPDERFLDTVRRIGVKPFKERVYATPAAA